MAFKFSNIMETEAEEKLRLFRSGFQNLAQREVRIKKSELKGSIVSLCDHKGKLNGITVVITNRVTSDKSRTLDDGRYLRYDGHYIGVVVSSTNESYPVGGHDLSLWEADIRRSYPH